MARAPNRFRMSHLFLFFTRRSVEWQYMHDHIRKSLFQARLAVTLGFVMYLIFGALDLLNYPNAIAVTVPVRFVLVPAIFIACFVLTFTHRTFLEYIIITALVAAQTGHILLAMSGAFSPQYVYGVTIIVLMFLFVFSRIRYASALILSAFFVGSFFIPAVVLGWQAQVLLESVVFLLSFWFLGIAAGYSLERIMRHDFVQSRVLDTERRMTNRLLLNILPREVSRELKERGVTRPVRHEQASILFADFVGFTQSTERFEPGVLVATLDTYFSHFDALMGKYRIEKIKTIGDAYMAASGIPVAKPTHAVDCVLAGLDFLEYVRTADQDSTDLMKLGMRIGINSGPVVAGVLGRSKFTYDIFGAAVNLASRVQTAAQPGELTISRNTWLLVKDFFACTNLGKVPVKNNQEIEVFAVTGFLPELSLDPEGTLPNHAFVERYEALAMGTVAVK